MSQGQILQLNDVHVTYEGIISALRGVSLEVPEGAVVALLGGNGAGKSTTLKAASGLLPAERGEVTAGTIAYRGRGVAGRSARDLVRDGLVQVLEGRRCFAHLSVEENLVAGSLGRGSSRHELLDDIERVLSRFERLRARRRAAAGFLSGGEQQMLAIGRALMARPKLILLDEPSMGLAPQVVEHIFEIVRELNREEGTSFLLAEQNATLALRYADFGYVLENGRVATSGSAAELVARPEIREFYLGVGNTGRKSLRRKRPPVESTSSG